MSPPAVLALWVLAGMGGALLELRELRAGRHPYADALRAAAPVVVLFGLVAAAIGGPVYLAGMVSRIVLGGGEP